jgi:hypothetical protein
MKEEKYRLPLFDGNNYPDWKFRMSVYLDKLDLLRYIETPLSKLLEENPETGNGLVQNDKKCQNRIIQKLVLVKCQLLEEETKTMTKRSVGSRTPRQMFVVVLERAAAASWYGMKSGAISTGRRSGRFVLVALT